MTSRSAHVCCSKSTPTSWLRIEFSHDKDEGTVSTLSAGGHNIRLDKMK